LSGQAKTGWVNINNARNLALVGQGATLLCDDLSLTVVIGASSNVSVTGLEFDMVRMPYTYGMVTASVIAFNETEYPYAGPLGVARYPWLLAAQGVLGFDPVHWRVAVDAVDIYALTDPIRITYDAARPGLLTLMTPALPVGGWMVVRHQTYSMNAFTGTAVAGLTLTDVTIWTTAGMGVVTVSDGHQVLIGYNHTKQPHR
jgi:hypothetical protein